jgi:putative membrane protein
VSDDAIAEAIDRIERSTDAEIVVVVAARAEPVRDLPILVGTVAGAVVALASALVPWTIPWSWFVVESVGVGLVAGWLASRTPSLTRLLPASRRRAAARRAAAEAFLADAVHGTPHRTGVLVFVAEAEREVVVLPDLGIEGLVPPAVWASVPAGFRGVAPSELLAGLDALGQVLARHVPLRAESATFDLPDAPRRR